MRGLLNPWFSRFLCPPQKIPDENKGKFSPVASRNTARIRQHKSNCTAGNPNGQIKSEF